MPGLGRLSEVLPLAGLRSLWLQFDDSPKPLHLAEGSSQLTALATVELRLDEDQCRHPCPVAAFSALPGSHHLRLPCAPGVSNGTTSDPTIVLSPQQHRPASRWRGEPTYQRWRCYQWIATRCRRPHPRKAWQSWRLSAARASPLCCDERTRLSTHTLATSRCIADHMPCQASSACAHDLSLLPTRCPDADTLLPMCWCIQAWPQLAQCHSLMRLCLKCLLKIMDPQVLVDELPKACHSLRELQLTYAYSAADEPARTLPSRAVCPHQDFPFFARSLHNQAGKVRQRLHC